MFKVFVAAVTLGLAGIVIAQGNLPNEFNKSPVCISNENQTTCRFNADCCSNLCSTYNAPEVKCVENTPANHVADSLAQAPVYADFKPIKFVGMERWKDKVAVITGAASGMGFALAKRLCNEGMIVVGVDMNKDGVEKVSEQCPKNYFHPFTADLRREKDILKLFNFVDSALGRVDVLVNNAGIARITPLMDVSSEAIRSMYDTNVLAPILCTREALKIMMARNITDGYIMFTNSVAGNAIQQDAPGGKSLPIHAYESTKHALKVVREGLRQELRAKGLKIRVGEVSPESVITNINESLVPRDVTNATEVKRVFDGIGKYKDVERLSPDDIAEAFVYMLQAPARMDINTILVENN